MHFMFHGTKVWAKLLLINTLQIVTLKFWKNQISSLKLTDNLGHHCPECRGCSYWCFKFRSKRGRTAMLVGFREGSSKRKNTGKGLWGGNRGSRSQERCRIWRRGWSRHETFRSNSLRKKRSRAGPWGLRNEVQRAYNRPEIYAKSVFLHTRTHTGTLPVRNQSFLCKNILKESLNC